MTPSAVRNRESLRRWRGRLRNQRGWNVHSDGALIERKVHPNILPAFLEYAAATDFEICVGRRFEVLRVWYAANEISDICGCKREREAAFAGILPAGFAPRCDERISSRQRSLPDLPILEFDVVNDKICGREIHDREVELCVPAI